jgi:hypothetical protein
MCGNRRDSVQTHRHTQTYTHTERETQEKGGERGRVRDGERGQVFIHQRFDPFPTYLSTGILDLRKRECTPFKRLISESFP